MPEVETCLLAAIGFFEFEMFVEAEKPVVVLPRVVVEIGFLVESTLVRLSL